MAAGPLVERGRREACSSEGGQHPTSEHCRGPPHRSPSPRGTRPQLSALAGDFPLEERVKGRVRGVEPCELQTEAGLEPHPACPTGPSHSHPSLSIPASTSQSRQMWTDTHVSLGGWQGGGHQWWSGKCLFLWDAGGLGLGAEQSCLGKGYDTSAGRQFLCKAPGRPPGEGILCVDFTT